MIIATIPNLTGSIPTYQLLIRALSFYGITKWAHKYLSPVLFFFKNQIAQYTLYLLNSLLWFFTVISSVAKGASVSFFMFFAFSQ